MFSASVMEAVNHDNSMPWKTCKTTNSLKKTRHRDGERGGVDGNGGADLAE